MAKDSSSKIRRGTYEEAGGGKFSAEEMAKSFARSGSESSRKIQEMEDGESVDCSPNTKNLGSTRSH